jgi:hypothetical protein
MRGNFYWRWWRITSFSTQYITHTQLCVYDMHVKIPFLTYNIILNQLSHYYYYLCGCCLKLKYKKKTSYTRQLFCHIRGFQDFILLKNKIKQIYRLDLKHEKFIDEQNTEKNHSSSVRIVADFAIHNISTET